MVQLAVTISLLPISTIVSLLNNNIIRKAYFDNLFNRSDPGVGNCFGLRAASWPRKLAEGCTLTNALVYYSNYFAF